MSAEIGGDITDAQAPFRIAIVGMCGNLILERMRMSFTKTLVFFEHFLLVLGGMEIEGIEQAAVNDGILRLSFDRAGKPFQGRFDLGGVF